MRNSTKQRWLVKILKNKDKNFENYSATTQKLIMGQRCRQELQKPQKSPCLILTLQSARVRPVYNQIVEVLSVLVLVNSIFGTYAMATEDKTYEIPIVFDEMLTLQHRGPHKIGYFNFDKLPEQTNQYQRNNNFKINPKPCTFGHVEGTCMFVWECIKTEGKHVGMCVDSFMFGSCCAHNYTDNFILPQSIFSYTRPTKPLGYPIGNHISFRPRPSHQPHKPANSGMTTIERPHGAGTLVIRPSGPHHQGALSKPNYSRPSSTVEHTTNNVAVSTPVNLKPLNADANDLQASANIPSFLSATPHQQYWHLTTEPNFVTKPRPFSSMATLPLHVLNPIAPSKKPVINERPLSSESTKPSTTQLMPSPASVDLSDFTKPTKPASLSPTTHHVIMLDNNQPTTSSSELSLELTNRPSSVLNTTPMSTIQSTTTSTNLPSELTIDTNEIHEISIDSQIPGSVKTISAALSECGVPVLARPETRIVGGKSAAFGRWPWQVSVRRTSFFGFSSTHRCGGALINENWIATAGHCVDDLLVSQIRIRVGEYDFSHVQEQLPYVERGVSKKVVHPKYNFFTYEYDLALVKLEQSLEFAPHVSPICLPETESLLIGMNATVTGWGRLSEGGTLPSVLQEVSVPIVSNDICKSMFLRAGRQEFIPDIFLCAGYESGGQDSCQGDSGGPLQVRSQDGRFFLAGIISWGIGCAEANLPGVCTRISKFVPWIMEHVR